MIELIGLVVGLAFVGTGAAYRHDGGWPAIIIGLVVIAFCIYRLTERGRSSGTEGE